MQRTKKLEEKNNIKTREKNEGRKIKTLLSLPIHLVHHSSAVEPLSLRCHCRSVVAPLLHRYHSAIIPLLLRHFRSVVVLLSHRYRTGIAPLSLRCCRSCCCSCCRYAVTPLSYRYCSTVAPLLSLLLSLRSRTAIAPVSLHCLSAAVAPAVATQSHHYRTGIAPLSLRCCHSC